MKKKLIVLCLFGLVGMIGITCYIFFIKQKDCSELQLSRIESFEALDNTEEHTVNMMQSFQRIQDEVYFLQRNVLSRYRKGKKDENFCIKNVTSFCKVNGVLYYQTKEKDLYFLSGDKEKFICSGIEAFYFDKEAKNILVFKRIMYQGEVHFQILAIDDNGDTIQNIRSFKPKSDACGEKVRYLLTNKFLLLYWSTDTELKYYSLCGQADWNMTIKERGDVFHGIDNLFYLPQKKCFYVAVKSFQQTSEDMDLQTKVLSECDGLWEVSIQDQKSKQIMQESFDSYYMCNGTIVGQKDSIVDSEQEVFS